MLMSFGIILGSVSLALIGADAAFDLVWKTQERRMLRETNIKLTHENTALKTRNELLETRMKSKQCMADTMKQTQIDDLLAENRRIKMLLDQKWEGATDGKV